MIRDAPPHTTQDKVTQKNKLGGFNYMGSKYEIRTKDGKSHYLQGFWQTTMFFLKNVGNMYYIRVNFH